MGRKRNKQEEKNHNPLTRAQTVEKLLTHKPESGKYDKMNNN